MKQCKVEGCIKPVSDKRLVCAMHHSRMHWYKSYDLPKGGKRKNGEVLERDEHGNKYCPRCEQWLALDQFYTSTYALDGLKTPCRVCGLVGKYGLTRTTFDELLLQQGGVCAICKSASTKTYHVDHNHACCDKAGSCGACVRGLLCGSCNTMLGQAKDSAVLLRQAAQYVEEHTGNTQY